ncbi:MAG: glycosyltransferase family 2 protein, partial [Candidatus Woesebacteria bacterium]|nr:glycosyltransferase family 2 protein [Candidatus Woesebacteria bacterium]
YIEHTIQSVINADSLGFLKEIVIVDDGSKDSTFEEARKIAQKDPKVKVIKLRGWFGKSIALQSGFDNSKGDIIITMDADLQDNPEEIPVFLKKIHEGYDLVSGWKKHRYDPISKKIPSKVGNYLTRILTGIKVHDLNCGFKAYKKEVIKNINLYGELYKFIPLLAGRQNFKVAEIVVKHHPRKYGKSKFGWERNIKGFLDLLTVVFLTGYSRRPGHFFGFFGLLSFTAGFVIGLFITYLRITTGSIQYRQPLLFVGMLLMIIGIQFISTGLVAEMIVNLNQKDTSTDKYIEKKII